MNIFSKGSFFTYIKINFWHMSHFFSAFWRFCCGYQWEINIFCYNMIFLVVVAFIHSKFSLLSVIWFFEMIVKFFFYHFWCKFCMVFHGVWMSIFIEKKMFFILLFWLFFLVFKFLDDYYKAEHFYFVCLTNISLTTQQNGWLFGGLFGF